MIRYIADVNRGMPSYHRTWTQPKSHPKLVPDERLENKLIKDIKNKVIKQTIETEKHL